MAPASAASPPRRSLRVGDRRWAPCSPRSGTTVEVDQAVATVPPTFEPGSRCRRRSTSAGPVDGQGGVGAVGRRRRPSPRRRRGFLYVWPAPTAPVAPRPPVPARRSRVAVPVGPRARTSTSLGVGRQERRIDELGERDVCGVVRGQVGPAKSQHRSSSSPCGTRSIGIARRSAVPGERRTSLVDVAGREPAPGREEPRGRSGAAPRAVRRPADHERALAIGTIVGQRGDDDARGPPRSTCAAGSARTALTESRRVALPPAR